MKRRLPDMMATTPVFDLLRALGVDAADPAAVMRVLAYRLAAKVERHDGPWGDPGTTELSVRYPVGGKRVEITARIVDSSAERRISTAATAEMAGLMLAELTRVRGGLNRLQGFMETLNRLAGGA